LKFGPDLRSTTKPMVSRREFLTFGTAAIGGGCAGALATIAVDYSQRRSEPPPATSGSSTISASNGYRADGIFVHDFSDGSGSATDDDEAVKKAFAAAARFAWSKPIIFARSFKILTEHLVPFGAIIEGIQENTVLQPQVPIRAVFSVTGGQVAIRNLTCSFPKFLSTNVLPCDFIRVDKPWDNYEVRLERLRGVLTRNIIRWIDGDLPQIDGIWGVNNIRALHFENNGMNGRITNIFQLGGGGLYLGRNTAAPKPQQMEGTGLSSLRILPADVGPDGAASLPGLEMHAGLALRFYDLLVDSAHHGGILIDATAYPIDDIEFYGLWLGGGGAAGTSGLTATGAATRIHVYGGKIVGFPHWGVIFDKTERFLLDGIEMKLNGTKGVVDGGDLLSIGANGTVRSCDFNSTARTVSETDGSLIYGEDNYFSASAIPASVASAVNWQRSSGPGAPI
jgi:hypothetical protein